MFRLTLLNIIPFASLFWVADTANPPEFRSQFEKEVAESFSYLRNYEEEICRASFKYSLPSEEVIAVFFPELVKYHMNPAEQEDNSRMESLYINIGSREADFPFGPFEMRPSFVEMIEKVILRYPEIFEKYDFIADYESQDIKSIRSERVTRLKDPVWQIQYAFAFYRIASLCFPPQNFDLPEDRIKFYAGAYHLGFSRTIKDIENKIDSETFPFGKKYNGRQWSYAAIASDFFKNDFTPVECRNNPQSFPVN